MPNAPRRADAQAVVKLMQKVTGKKPKLWGPTIIGFDEYHYRYASAALLRKAYAWMQKTHGATA